MTKKEERGARREWLATAASVFKLAGPSFIRMGTEGRISTHNHLFLCPEQRLFFFFFKVAMENEVLNFALKKKSENVYFPLSIPGIYGLRKSEQTSHSEVI